MTWKISISKYFEITVSWNKTNQLDWVGDTDQKQSHKQKQGEVLYGNDSILNESFFSKLLLELHSVDESY